MRKMFCILLVALVWAASALAGNTAAGTVLNVETQDGQTCHFLLTDQQPAIKSQNGQMQVTYLAQAGDSERAVLTFQHQDVKLLTFSAFDPTAIPAVKPKDGNRVYFDLTTPGRVVVHGLGDGEQVTVYTLDGRSVLSPVRSSGGSIAVDLSGQRRGTYLICAGRHRTFKYSKP